MSCNTLDPLLTRLRNEPLFNRLPALQSESHIHPTPTVLVCRSDEEISLVDEAVDERGFRIGVTGEWSQRLVGSEEGEGGSGEEGTEDEGTEVDGESGGSAGDSKVSQGRGGGGMRRTCTWIRCLPCSCSSALRGLEVHRMGARGRS